MKSDNPIRRLREELEMNQPEFARMIGRSHQSLGNYERGNPVPLDVIEKLKTIAAERGLADIALELTSDDWHVRHVLLPGEKFISEGKIVPPPAHPNHQRWHDLLEAILTSGNAAAINAVQSLLVVFEKDVHKAKPAAPAKPVKRVGTR